MVLVLLLLDATSVRAELQPCPAETGCVEVAVAGPDHAVPRGEAFAVSLRFQPAGDDGVAGGLDEIAALTFSLGIPGLELADCSSPNADGLTAAVTPRLAAGEFRIIVENTTCDANAARPCLCPGAGQTRATYVNLAIFGLKLQEAPDPDALRSLPAGELLTLTLRPGPGAASTVPLHIFAETDDPDASPKPTFGAQVSVGDTTGVDRSTAGDVSRIRTVDGEVSVVEPPTATMTPSVTETHTPTTTQTPTETHTPAPSSTPTDTAVPTATSAETTATESRTPTLTPVAPTATPIAPTPVDTETPLPTPTRLCTGDCGGDGGVSLEDRVTGVRIALGQLPLAECLAFNANNDDAVTVEELVAGVKASIDGCQ
jgi:hypothetical protein